jgi:hypothetical protein
MAANRLQPRRSALLSFRFLGTAMIGSLTMALVCAFAPQPAQLAVLGGLLSILAGLLLAFMGQEEEREHQRAELLGRLGVPLTLAPDPDLYAQYAAFCQALTGLAAQPDPVLRDIALLKLASVNGQLAPLAGGEVSFGSTEAWRTVYERLLGSPDVREYRSVAWVRTAGYWQDPPGRQSMLVNFQAAARGTLIERVVILRGDLWPPGQPLPAGAIRPWVEEQHNHGLWVLLVREADLAGEPDLLTDMGIYGNRAVGVQELDEHARTARFVLHFDPQAVRLAEDRWRRLLLYATPYRTILDRLPPDA